MLLNSIKPKLIARKLQSICFTRRIRGMRFAANISSLFEDIPNHLESYKQVVNRSDYSFDAIEAQNPYECSLEEWKQLRREVKSLKWLLINSPPLWNTYNEVMPTLEQFEKVLKQTADYVKELNVSKVHLVMKDIKDNKEIPQIIELLSYGARYLQPLGVVCVLEPLSIRPNYYLRSYSQAIDIVQQISQPNVKIMLDTYHLQRLHGNLVQNIQTMQPYIGHVQVSQVPLRNCPVGDGEINHNFILKKINEVYKDYIGLEYINNSRDSFSWLNQFTQL